MHKGGPRLIHELVRTVRIIKQLVHPCNFLLTFQCNQKTLADSSKSDILIVDNQHHIQFSASHLNYNDCEKCAALSVTDEILQTPSCLTWEYRHKRWSLPFMNFGIINCV